MCHYVLILILAQLPMDNPHHTFLSFRSPHTTPTSYSGAQKALGLFSGYIKSLQSKQIVEDVASSAGSKIAQVGFLALFDFSNLVSKPIYYSLKFSFSWLGKKLVCGFNPAAIQPDCEYIMSEEGFVFIQDTDTQPALLPPPNQTGLSDYFYQISENCKNYVLAVKPIDIANMAGGTVGAGVAGLTFALFVGAPGLLGIPVLLLSEVMAKGFGEYLAGIGAQNLLGNRNELPILMQAFKHIPAYILSGTPLNEQELASLEQTRAFVKQVEHEQALKNLEAEFELMEPTRPAPVSVLQTARQPQATNPVLPYYYYNNLSTGASVDVGTDLDTPEHSQDNTPSKLNLSPNK